jgi:tetratricopeptide (TPR) repeat protein
MATSVFISSTSLDLKKYRQTAIEVCHNLGFEPIAMESFEAMGVGATEGSKRKLREADLYIGIIAHRYGYIEAGHERSVTELEFDYAGERGLERLCFLIDPKAAWPKTHYDKKNLAKLNIFKDKVEAAVIRSLFRDVDDFRTKLTNALLNWQEWRTARAGELEAVLATTADDVPNRPEVLVGRDLLVTEVQSLLDKGKRVLLQGFGGMGKTALAAAVAAERIHAGNGPVIWLRAGTAERDDLLVALARPFNAQQAVLKENGTTNQARVVRLLLQENQVRLIVLDDVWNARALTQLLNINAIPGGVPILVTSRQRFTGLTRLDVGRLDRESALDLLCQVGDPEWRDDPDARQLCEKLGDHTYAVRLAGLTMALDGLSPAELLRRIASAPWKLAAPDGMEEEGRNSVEELLNTSLYGLDMEAQMTFRAFGAFFTASATAEMLSLYLQEARPTVEEALNRLQRRGLAERVADLGDDRAIEYRIHDLAYSYTRAQTTDEDHQRALDACLHYLERYREPLPENFAALRSELDNFIGATAYALTVERYADVQRFAHWLYRSFDTDNTEGFLHLQGYASVATTLLSQAVQASEALNEPAMQAGFLGSLGSAYRDLGQVKTGMKFYRQALKLYRDLQDVPGEGVTLGRIGIAYRLSGQAQPAIEHLQQALEIARRFNNSISEGINLANLGIAYRLIGQGEQGKVFLEEALVIARARGDKRGEAINLGNIGDSLRDQNQVEAAIEHYDAALKIAYETSDRRGAGINLGRLGDAYRALGQHTRATEYLEQALAIAREIGDKRSEAINLGRLGDTYRDLDNLIQAIAYHQRGLSITRQMDDKRGEAYGLTDLGLDYRHQGQTQQAREHLQQARIIFESLGMQQRVMNIDDWMNSLN